VKVQYTGHFGHRPVHIVVYHHEGGELPACALFLGAEGDAPIDLGGVVPAPFEALALDLG
jgi:hypothetical protein